MTEKETPKKIRIHYWVQRFCADSEKLTDDQKTALSAAYIKHFCRLSDEELALFADPDFVPGPADMDKTMKYVAVEEKVIFHFGSEGTSDKNSPVYKAQQLAADGYRESFNATLLGFYSQEELDEIASYIIDPTDWATVKVLLIGMDNWLNRRIRNAYLPGMVDLIEIGPNGARDITHTLFDGPDDAATQIDRLMGVEKKE